MGLRLCKRRTLSGRATWPATADELTQLQRTLGEMTPEHWKPPTTVLRIGACVVCFERVHGAGAAGEPYRPTLLALREGPPPEQTLRALEIVSEVLLINAMGRDHPRRAGLALHLGAMLGCPRSG